MTTTTTARTLHSALSLWVFASNDKITPVIATIRLQRVGRVLSAYATDRYCVARGLYELQDDNDEATTDETVFIEAQTAKSFLPLVKQARPQAMVTITDTEITVHDHIETVIPLTDGNGRFKTNGYPPVERLFPDNLDTYSDNPVGVVSLRPDFVAKLSKIQLPNIQKHDPKRPWRFHFGADNYTNKPAPVVCEPVVKDGGEVLVMIQPNLLTN